MGRPKYTCVPTKAVLSMMKTCPAGAWPVGAATRRTGVAPAMPRSSVPTISRGIGIFMGLHMDRPAGKLEPSHYPGSTQPGHLRRRHAELREHGVRVLAEPGRRGPDR